MPLPPDVAALMSCTDDNDNDNKDEKDAAAGVATSATTTTTTTTGKFFGVDVQRYTNHCREAPDFADAGLRAVMEPHLKKARHKRQQALDSLLLKKQQQQQQATVEDGHDENPPMHPLSSSARLVRPYPALRKEHAVRYDAAQFPLAEQLSKLLDLRVPLSLLHTQTTGKNKDKSLAAKRALLAPLLDRDRRHAFQQTFDDFVARAVIPHLHRQLFSKGRHTTGRLEQHYYTVRYQAFPCLRVVRPGEFSIGPHCDVAYGHALASLNVHIPLTQQLIPPSVGGDGDTAAASISALYTESSPGMEDWHALVQCCSSSHDDEPSETMKGGDDDAFFVVFNGSECIHFTLENTTDETRVSLDFRLALVETTTDAENEQQQEQLLCSSRDVLLQDRYSDPVGYYDWMDVIVEDGGNCWAQRRHGQGLLDPDRRVGFPFVNPPAVSSTSSVE